MASRFPYIFVMAATTNKENKENFYELFKEILETQNTIIKNQAEIREAIAAIGGQKAKPSDADIWENI